jgi:hypothetical protein
MRAATTLNPKSEGYLDRAAEAKRKGRDASLALCFSGAAKATLRPAMVNVGRPIMTLCPVALAVGCIKCPIVDYCPGKSIIGDYKKEVPPPDLKKKQ